MRAGVRFPRWQVAVFALFGLAPVFVVLQTVATDRGHEPFPALILPAFGAAPKSDNTAVLNDPTFIVSFEDATVAEFDAKELVGPSVVPQLFIVRHAFAAPGPRSRDPRTVAWLRNRLDELAPGRRPTEVAVVWTRTVFELPSGDRRSSEEARRVLIDLR